MRILAVLGLTVLVGVGCHGSTTVGARPTPAPPTSAPLTSAPLTSAPLTSAPPTSVHPPSVAVWPTYQGDSARSGVDRTSAAASGLARQWASPKLDGQLYGQPLLAAGHVIVATEADTVYALDPASGGVQWTQHLGTPMRLSALPCGNIDPSGITGTPVIDVNAGLVWAVAFVQPGRHDLVAVDLASGAIRSRRSIDPPGVSPLVEQQRGALTLSGGRVLVPYGGLYGDCGDYHGYVGTAPATGTGDLHWWQTPSAREEGIWAPPGAVVDRQGRVFVATGNGVSTTSFDDSNAVVRLSADLVQDDVFAPANWTQLNDHDADIGSLSPSLVGGQVLQVGKRGVGYLLSADHLGGVGGQRFQAQVCTGGAYGGTAVDGSTVYVPCRDGLVAVSVANGRFRVAWRGPATPAGTPVVSGGVVWLMSVNGEVLGLDPATGRTRFHSQEAAAGSFPALTAAGGQLLVPSGATVVAYRY